jgi:copper transport protein
MGAKRTARIVASLLLATIAAGVLAAPASAHAVLERTLPGDDAVVERPPQRVVLRFDEPVDAVAGALRVLDARGRRVDAGRVERPAPAVVAAPVEPGLARGTYTVVWRVVSADSDPISGAFVFHVGERGAQPEGIAAQIVDEPPRAVSVLFAVWRGLEFALLLACVGGAAVLTLVLGDAGAPVRRRLFGVLAAAAGALAAVALASIVLQGAAAAGTGLGEALSSELVRSVVDTRFGAAALVRAGLALALLVVALRLRALAGRSAERAAGVVLVPAVALAATPSWAGHAGVSGADALAADAAHVLAAGAWVGGLAFLMLALVVARESRWRLASLAVPRFSNLAVVAVAVVVVAGTINAILQVGAWRGLWETTYGLLLLAKLALLLPLLALGALNNRVAVPRLRAGLASAVERRRFVRATGAELVLMVAVVGVTAVLVSAPPARTEVAMGAPVARTVQLDGLRAHLEVRPARAGANELHVMLEGPDPRAEEVRLAATLADGGIGPLEHRAARAGTGAWVVHRAVLPVAGDWRIRIDVVRGELDLVSATVSIPIREP